MKLLDKLTLSFLLDSAVKEYEHMFALSLLAGTDSDVVQSLTYGDLEKKAKQIAGYLKKAGAKQGDRIAILSSNMPNWVVTYFGIHYGGQIAVPILPDFHAEEVENILKHSGAQIVFASEKLLDKVKNKNNRTIICLNDLTLIGTDGKRNPLELEDVYSVEVEEEDIACIIYTSGTTGQSKGVILTHKNLVFDAVAASAIPQVKPGYAFLSILPLSHTYECTIGMLTPLHLGGHIYYMDKPPAPAVLLPALKKVKPHFMLSVPLLIEKIYRMSIVPGLKKNALFKFIYNLTLGKKMLHKIAGKKLKKVFGGRLSFFGIGGAALAPDVEQFLREAKFPYAVGYGLTETAPLIAGCSPEKTKYRSTGPVLSGVAVKIDNPDPETQEGEIIVKGPNVMPGYYKDEERSKEVFTEAGWFRTGDLGYLDKDGYLYIRGRLKSMILGPSGENIYPEAIEAVINEFSFVNESIVFQEEGKIVALVHIDREAISQHIKDFADSASHVSNQVAEYLNDLKKSVNKRLNTFSKVSKVEEHTEPFEKTPTKKIKRYLYIQKESIQEKAKQLKQSVKDKTKRQ